jgi:hypothetical protein
MFGVEGGTGLGARSVSLLPDSLEARTPGVG